VAAAAEFCAGECKFFDTEYRSSCSLDTKLRGINRSQVPPADTLALYKYSYDVYLLPDLHSRYHKHESTTNIHFLVCELKAAVEWFLPLFCVWHVAVDRQHGFTRTRNQSIATTSWYDGTPRPPAAFTGLHGCATPIGQSSKVSVTTSSAESSDRKLSHGHVTYSWQTSAAEVGLLKWA